MTKTTLQNPTLLFTIILFIACITKSTLIVVTAQNCGCDPTYCCSQYGYCGTSEDYCGTGCQDGPCDSSTPSPVGGGGGDGGGISISDLVTDEFFDGIINQASSSCKGVGFYSRSSFLDALSFYSEFGNGGGSKDDNVREVAAFFAQVTHESGHFCYVEEIAKSVYCDKTKTQWPCNPNKKYYGRGPIQITWNYNYGPAGDSIGFDGLNTPETVANDPVVAFRTAFWFWMKNVHSIMVSGRGFGATIRAINGGECNGRKPAAVKARISYYTKYCNQFGVSPGDNLSC